MNSEHSCHGREGFARDDFVAMGAQRWQTFEAGFWRKAGCLCTKRESLIRSGSAGCRGGRGHLAQIKSIQRNPEGGVAVSVGTANEITGDAGGVVVIVCAERPRGTRPGGARAHILVSDDKPAVPAATTAPAPMAAESNLILFC